MKLVVTGANGQVGHEFRALAQQQRNEGIECDAFGSGELDITRQRKLYRTLRRTKCDYVVNAAAYTAVDAAQNDEARCLKINQEGVRNLAKACKRLGVPLIHISTDYVFNGQKASPYVESDLPAPLNVYGKSKWGGEEVLRQMLNEHIILRVSWVFSDRRSNFVKTMVGLCSQKDELRVVDDQLGAPTPASDIARVLMAIVKQLSCGAPLWGTYHYCASGSTSWYGFAREIIDEASKHKTVSVKNIVPIKTADYNYKAPRPLNSQMACHKIRDTFGIRQRPWQPEMARAVKKFCEDEEFAHNNAPLIENR